MQKVNIHAGYGRNQTLTHVPVLQNRAFQQVVPGTSSALQAWSAVNGAGISVVNSTTPVSSALPNSLQVTIPSTASGSVGVANSGYFGKKIYIYLTR